MALTGPNFFWLYSVVGPHFIYCYRPMQHTWFAKVSGGRRSACESDLKDTHSALWMVKNNECKVNICLFTRKLPSAPLTLGGRPISCCCSAAITIFTFMTEKTTPPQHSDSVDVFPIIIYWTSAYFVSSDLYISDMEIFKLPPYQQFIAPHCLQFYAYSIIYEPMNDIFKDFM